MIAVSTILLCATLIPQNNTEKGPSDEICRMDAMLLNDLRQQEIVIDKVSEEQMDCSGMEVADVKNLFRIEDVNYDKCDPGNCHYTSYTIESKTKAGKTISFVVTSGEDGNHLQDMHIEGCE